ncbi:MAG: DNA gyrase subunit A [Deltaproteobacteria bacterium]|nr:DNA gyrase subunit A [Deltaproteobacteria bacterium]
MVKSAELISVNIEEEMKSSYLSYAMSVIIGRALPDIRDGLKPAHRRILYAMFREGLLSSKRYSKCAGVVGEVLKKYHPHGDAAVYDTLVRMAQDWNMRYPLIDGQGNFGCFTGDTKVRLADGSTKSFLDLVQDNAQGKTHFTYTITSDGSIKMAPIRAPRLTKSNAPIVRVTLDSGEQITCTPDHRFMLRDGTYCEAQFLQSGSSLMPLYSRLYAGEDKDLKGYEEVYNPHDNKWVFAHRLADACNMASLKMSPRRKPGSRKSYKHWIPAFAGMTSMGFLEMPNDQISEIEKLRKGSELCTENTAHLNHKVLSVKPAGSADVYDLTVDGTHNFALASGVFVHNSIDGDSAAAYRYTEARLTKIAEEILEDIDKDTVDFVPNFDGSTVEPVVLPSKIPNLLLNGSDGIAVGMATKIPPHNLKELVNGLVAMIENPKITIPELMKHIPGPDFPTGAALCGREGIKNAYNTGRGKLIIRAKAMIEPIAKGDREAIVITEIPYQVNKARLVERIAALVNDDKLEGISDIRDESDRDGMRVVVELKRGVVAGIVLNQLYKHTPMEESFGIIMLAIINQQPKVVNLKEMLYFFVEHRKEVVTRRTAYDLRKAEERAHILEGLKIALEHIDEIIALIKKSKEPQAAKEALRLKYKLSDIQAQAILDMRLQRLTGLERAKIIEEYEELQKIIKELKAILADERRILKIITDELKVIKEKFGDERRTEIQGAATEIKEDDLIQEEEMVVTISHGGYIKRNPVSLYRAQRRGGRGKTGMTTREEDFVEDLFIASTKSYVLVFSSKGKVYWLKVHEIPQAGRATKGKAINNLVMMASDEKLAAIMVVKEFVEGNHVVLVTKNGTIKKTELTAFNNPRASGIIAIGLDAGDEVVGAKLTNGKQEIVLSTRQGKAIHFHEEDVRSMGRQAGGVRGIHLAKGDEVVSMEVLNGDQVMLLTVTEKGYGKRTEAKEYRVQSRGGTGIFTCKITEKNGPVVGVMQVTEGEDIMLVTDKGKIIRTRASGISIQGRATQGVRLINVEEGERVTSVARLAEKEEEEIAAITPADKGE